MDSFPEWATPAYRRFWLDFSVPVLEAQARLKGGAVPDEELYDVALLAHGDEDVASDILAARLEWRNKSGRRG